MNRNQSNQAGDRRRIALLLFVPFAIVLLANAFKYYPFLSDDALISLRYANRLLQGNGLTWTAGHPVEGYSNLLWILAVAGVGLSGVDLIDAARGLGVAGMLTAMFAVCARYAQTDPLRVSWLPITASLLFLSFGAPMAVWAIGGLEQPLQAALVAVSIALALSILESPPGEIRRTWYLSLVLGLLSITRPDGPLFGVGTAAAFLLAALLQRRWDFGRRAAVVLSLPAVFYVGQALFRFAYYHEVVPNTALVKMTPSVVHWKGGWEYFSGGMFSLSPFSAVAIASLIGLLVPAATRTKGLYLLILASSWSAYVVFIGGDIFPAYRHLVPVMVVLAFALAEFARLLIAPGRRYGWYIASAGLLIALVIPYSRNQSADKHNQRALRERWEWECQELALSLRAAFANQQPLTAVTAAGCLPYWSEFPAVDMMGLNDHYLPRHPPPDLGAGFIGHELGDGKYVFSRKPDLIVFNVGSGPHYRSGEELDRMPEFHQRYVAVRLHMPASGAERLIYVNKDSEKEGIGVLRSTGAFAVPGFLLTGPDTSAYLNGSNKLVARLRSGETAAVRFDSGRSLKDWDVRVRTSQAAAIETELEQDGTRVLLTVRSNTLTPVDIEGVTLTERR
jgi:hypothetical protein